MRHQHRISDHLLLVAVGVTNEADAVCLVFPQLGEIVHFHVWTVVEPAFQRVTQIVHLRLIVISRHDDDLDGSDRAKLLDLGHQHFSHAAKGLLPSAIDILWSPGRGGVLRRIGMEEVVSDGQEDEVYIQTMGTGHQTIDGQGIRTFGNARIPVIARLRRPAQFPMVRVRDEQFGRIGFGG